MKSKTLNKDAILNIFNDLQEKNRIQTIKEQDKSKQIEQENNFEDVFFMNCIPQTLRDRAKVLIEMIKKNENFILDKYGYLKVKSSGVMMRLEDILKALLVKNSSIKSIEGGLKDILKFIPRELIMNRKSTNLKNELEDENKEFQGGRQIPIKWTHFED